MAKDGSRWDCGGSGLFLPDHDFPGTHFPLFDETVYDVRILAHELFDFALVIYAKNQQRAVNRIIKRAAQNELSPFAPRARDAQMLFAEFAAARDVVVHGFVD